MPAFAPPCLFDFEPASPALVPLPPAPPVPTLDRLAPFPPPATMPFGSSADIASPPGPPERPPRLSARRMSNPSAGAPSLPAVALNSVAAAALPAPPAPSAPPPPPAEAPARSAVLPPAGPALPWGLAIGTVVEAHAASRMPTPSPDMVRTIIGRNWSRYWWLRFMSVALRIDDDSIVGRFRHPQVPCVQPMRRRNCLLPQHVYPSEWSLPASKTAISPCYPRSWI